MGGCERMGTYFDQKGQHVHGNQTNIVGDVDTVSVGTVTDSVSLIPELERLRAQLAESAERGDVDQETATEAEYRLAQAHKEAAKHSPDHGRLLGYLTQAQDVLKNAA